MGFRTVLVLSNDQAHEWQFDPGLGRKIWEASCGLFMPNSDGSFEYGTVVEQVHADVRSVIIADSLSGEAVAGTHWCGHHNKEKRDLEMLKVFADKLGYRVSKKPTKV